MTTKTICTTKTAPLDDLLGKAIIVRAVTHYYTGLLEAYDESWLVLDEASWIADTGRWSTALANGSLNEVEPYPGKCLISRGAIVDLSSWNHALPRIVK